MPLNKTWQRLLLFKAGWLALVLAGDWATVLILPLLLWLYLLLGKKDRQSFLLLAGLGLLLDSILVLAGIFRFDGDTPWLPLWLIVLWGWFAWCWVSTLQHLLRQPLLVLVFAVLGGPLAYQAGAVLNPAALQIGAASWYWPALAVGWGLLMLLWLQFRPQPCLHRGER
jgi:hypothetical protein